MTTEVPDPTILARPAWPADGPDAARGHIDEYYERYRAVEWALLHRQLMAGDPDQIQDKVAAKWNTVVSCLGAVAGELRKVLTAAKAVWEGNTYDEFERDLLPVMQRAHALAAKAQKMQSGLTMMSAMLALAQREAEAPPPPTAHDLAGTLDSTAGYTPSRAEQLRTQERLVRLVAELALKYFLVEQKVWHAPLPTPEPIPTPADPASQVASATPQPRLASPVNPVSPLDGAKPVPPPERFTHLVGPTSGAGGASPMLGGFPAVPMAAAVGGAAAGGEASPPRSRGWTSAETQWTSDGRRMWTDDARGGDPHPVLGDPAVA